MRLCLISSNIRFDNPADGVNAWPHRRSLLSEILLKHSPDIIATQEGRYSQLVDFNELLRDFEIVDHHRSWIKERMYPTFFIRKNRFELIKSEDLWLSETPEIAGSASFGSAFPRLLTWMKIQPKDTDKNLIVVNTHLDHVKSETRLEQVKVLGKEIKKLINPASKLIIMGDFNDSPTSETREILQKEFPFLIDSWKEFHSNEETSHHSFNGICDNGSRIDWIMVEKDVTIEHSLLDKSAPDGKYPSDHFPAICKIKL